MKMLAILLGLAAGDVSPTDPASAKYLRQPPPRPRPPSTLRTVLPDQIPIPDDPSPH